jgi:hypothetical protein
MVENNCRVAAVPSALREEADHVEDPDAPLPAWPLAGLFCSCRAALQPPPTSSVTPSVPVGASDVDHRNDGRMSSDRPYLRFNGSSWIVEPAGPFTAMLPGHYTVSVD